MKATSVQSIVVRLGTLEMSSSHHGSQEQRELLKRLMDQGNGTSKREYPDGRLSGDDEGTLAYAIAADLRHQIIRIEFNKPVDWLGLDKDSAEALRDKLTEKLMELRGIKADC